MIDLHCHILPGIDDGPATPERSLALARAAVAAGTSEVVATPHISWDYPANAAAPIAAAVTELRQALAEAAIPLRVHTGGELALTRAVDLHDAELVALRLGGPTGTYLLVECPLAPLAPGFEEQCVYLQERGHRILLAHPERCPALHRDPAVLERLVARGMLAQVTAGALTGDFGRTVQGHADGLLRGGLAHVVASDAHSAEHRPPSIAQELEAAGHRAQADWLGRAVPAAILDGSPLPPRPAAPAPPRGRLGRLLRG